MKYMIETFFSEAKSVPDWSRTKRKEEKIARTSIQSIFQGADIVN